MNQEELLHELRTFRTMNVSVLEIKPDDVLVLDYGEIPDMTQEGINMAHAVMGELFPSHRLLCIASGVKLGLVRQAIGEKLEQEQSQSQENENGKEEEIQESTKENSQGQHEAGGQEQTRPEQEH